MAEPTPARGRLLSGGLAARLEQLDLLSRKILADKLRGGRPSRRRAAGASVEFADFRDYVPGDDPRFIDWNVYARLDRLLLKLFMEERELFLHLLVDTSASCAFGQPDKGLYLKQTACALGYVGLVNHHRLSVSGLGGAAQSGPLRGRGSVGRMIDFIADLPACGAGPFAAACRRLAGRRKGVCVILSDLLIGGAELERGLRDLRAAGHELFCLQALSPQELDPPLPPGGVVRMTDLESSRWAEIPVSEPLLARYRANLAAHCQSVRQCVRRHGGAYWFARTDTPIQRMILDGLRRGGLLN
jgi:uncharacterized protein (DUF58 family)